MLTTVTSLISRRGREKDIVRAFEEAFADGTEGTHHVTTLLIQQCGGLNFLVSSFEGEKELDAWRGSERHQAMITAFEQDSLRELCTLGEPIVRMTVPSDSSGPKWKVLASTWIITYPLLLMLSGILGVTAPELPMALRLGITSLALSVASIWLINPLASSVTRVWRLHNQQMQVDVVRYGP
jgi:antibiotic biosynthesis monooxygenase (ABM) superfamily enzyme